MEKRSYKQIFDTADNLHRLAEILDTCNDMFDREEVDSLTHDRYLHLQNQSFLTIWGLWRYFYGTEQDKVDFEPVYKSVCEEIPDNYSDNYKLELEKLQFEYNIHDTAVHSAIDFVFDLLSLEIKFNEAQYPKATDTATRLRNARIEVSGLTDFINEELNE